MRESCRTVLSKEKPFSSGHTRTSPSHPSWAQHRGSGHNSPSPRSPRERPGQLPPEGPAPPQPGVGADRGPPERAGGHVPCRLSWLIPRVKPSLQLLLGRSSSTHLAPGCRGWNQRAWPLNHLALGADGGTGSTSPPGPHKIKNQVRLGPKAVLMAIPSDSAQRGK